MNISIVGTGYVGLVTGACFAEMGNQVTCVDIDETKIENLKNGIIPIFEPGLERLVSDNQKRGNLLFTTEIKDALEKSTICFIAVGTPMGEDGSADLHYVLAVAKSIGEHMVQPMIVVDKSTVPVGTADKVKAVIQTELDKRQTQHSTPSTQNLKFSVVSNPEFLKEGAAIDDFMHPDRVVVGADNDTALKTMSELYSPFMTRSDRFIAMDIKSAEMTKYTANAMLATKISFMNEIATICELVGADVNQVRHGIGSDSRIGYSFIYPGCGYGGSCFPKDVQALIKTSTNHDYKPRILDAVEAVNYDQKRVVSNKVIQRFAPNSALNTHNPTLNEKTSNSKPKTQNPKLLSGFTFAVWGLAFKPGTDDMRDASAIVVINELTRRGAAIQAYDPKAMDEALFYLKDNAAVSYVASKYDALTNADALILMTEWKEFRSPDFEEIAKRLKNKIIFDGRNQYNKDKLEAMGFEYFQIGVKAGKL